MKWEEGALVTWWPVEDCAGPGGITVRDCPLIGCMGRVGADWTEGVTPYWAEEVLIRLSETWEEKECGL